MRNSVSSWLNVPLLALCAVGASLMAVPAVAQPGPKINVGRTQISGFPEDWSHRHVIFSNPGTEADAIAKGNYDHWQSVVNNPRYVIQQLKANRKVEGPAAIDAEYRAIWLAHSGDFRPGHHGKPQTEVERDWSEPLGGPGLADGHYPAKYNYSTTAATCNDYVVFPTGAAGGATQATIVAFNNVYNGCSGFSGGKPSVRAAYNTGTGYTATTSPVISWDGSQVAFVQSNGTAAQLVLLKIGNSGTVSSPAAATPVTYSVTNTYRACAAPCYMAIPLGANDTSSAPYYVFEGTLGDTMFVGDDSGKVHEITSAFVGTPKLDTNTGWPVTASTETNPKLTSPVYDDGTSGRIFVDDASGYLHSFTAAGTPGAVGVSGQLEHNTTGTFEAPLVDSTTEKVYTFVGYSGDTNNPSYINYFPAGTALSGSFGSTVKWANGGSTNPATSHMRLGAFDNEYYVTNGTTGNLYTCENGVVYRIPITSGTLATAPTTFNQPVSTVGIASACSPVTEFLGTKSATTLSAAITTTTGTSVSVASGTGIANNDYIQVDSEIMKVTAGGGTGSLTVTRGADGSTAATHSNGATTQDVQDWLFLSVQGNGNATSCSGACVYNYNVISEPTTGTPVDGLAATGGTSGISIDTSALTTTGGTPVSITGQIYYSQLGGTSAIQASQSALQ